MNNTNLVYQYYYAIITINIRSDREEQLSSLSFDASEAVGAYNVEGNVLLNISTYLSNDTSDSQPYQQRRMYSLTSL